MAEIEHHLRVAMGGFRGNLIYFNDGKKDEPDTHTIKLKHGGKLAVKYIQDPTFFEQEAHMMRELAKHEIRNVLKSLWIDVPSQCIVFERYEKDLFHVYADPVQIDALSKEARFKIVADLADAVIDLHSIGISHRDLKPENVVVNATHDGLEIALCDFGLASLSTRVVRGVHGNVGSSAWVALETLLRKDYDTEPTDWWSFGLLAYLIIVGTPLYADFPNTTTYRDHFLRAIMKGWDTWWPQCHTQLAPKEKELIEACVCVDVSKRANASTIKSLSYFL